MYEVNLFGLSEMIRAVLPGMRRRGWGHILNISSVGGFSGSAAFAHYSASKFAVEGLSESLAAEVAPFGIRVTIIEPGAFRTGFRGNAMQRAREQIPAYAANSGKARAYMGQNHGTQAGDPAKAARAMMAVVASNRPPMRWARTRRSASGRSCARSLPSSTPGRPSGPPPRSRARCRWAASPCRSSPAPGYW